MNRREPKIFDIGWLMQWSRPWKSHVLVGYTAGSNRGRAFNGGMDGRETQRIKINFLYFSWSAVRQRKFTEGTSNSGSISESRGSKVHGSNSWLD